MAPPDALLSRSCRTGNRTQLTRRASRQRLRRFRQVTHDESFFSRGSSQGIRSGHSRRYRGAAVHRLGASCLPPQEGPARAATAAGEGGHPQVAGREPDDRTAGPHRGVQDRRDPAAGERRDPEAHVRRRQRTSRRGSSSTRSIPRCTRPPTTAPRPPPRRPSRRSDRYKPLAEANAVSKQDYDNAVAAGRADCQAAADTARINLVYTRLLSPIAGRIGRSAVTEGALVTANQTQRAGHGAAARPDLCGRHPVQRVLLRLKRELAAGQLEQAGDNQAQVHLLLEDGTSYEHRRQAAVRGVTVDQTTGSVTLRALFPNPDKILLPGMFVREQIEEGVAPMPCSCRSWRSPTTRTASRPRWWSAPTTRSSCAPIVTDRAIGDKWLVIEGLKAGDRVIVEGLQFAKPGASVHPQEAQPGAAADQPAPAAAAAPANVGPRAVVNFFIDRPIFAWVIAIVIMLAGGAGDPHAAGRAVSEHRAAGDLDHASTYPGASAETVQSTVTQVIEQQMSGIDHLLYFSSESDKDGSMTITLYLRAGHQSRHRAGAGAEQAAAGHAAAAARSAAAGPARGQGDARTSCSSSASSRPTAA